MQAVIGAVQCHDPLLATIIEKDLKRSGRRNNKLVAGLVGMGTARLATRYVVEIKYAFYLKGKLAPTM